MKFCFGYSTWLLLVGGAAVVGPGNTYLCSAFVLSGPLKPLEGLLTTPSIRVRDKLLPKGTGTGTGGGSLVPVESFTSTAEDSYYTTTDAARINVPYQYTKDSKNNNKSGLRPWGDNDRNQLKNGGKLNNNVVNGVGVASESQQSLGQQLALTRETLRERDDEVQQLRSELRVMQARLESQEDEYERYIAELHSQLGIGAGQRRWSASSKAAAAAAQTAATQKPLNANNSNAFSRNSGFLSRTPDEDVVPTTDFHNNRRTIPEERSSTGGFFHEEEPMVVPFGGNNFADPHFSRPDRRTALWSNGPSPAFDNREYEPNAFPPQDERFGFPADQAFDERRGPMGGPGRNGPRGEFNANSQWDDPRYDSSHGNMDPLAPPTLAVDGNNMDVYGAGKRTNPGFNLQGDSYSANVRKDINPDFFNDPAAQADNSLHPREDGFSSRPPSGSQFQAPMWQQGIENQPPPPMPMPMHFQQQTPLIELNDQGTTRNSKSETFEERAAASGYYGDGDRSRTRNEVNQNPRAEVFHDLNNNMFNDNNGFSSVGNGAVPYVQGFQQQPQQAAGVRGQFVQNDDMGGVLDPYDYRSQQQQDFFFENSSTNGQDQFFTPDSLNGMHFENDFSRSPTRQEEPAYYSNTNEQQQQRRGDEFEFGYGYGNDRNNFYGEQPQQQQRGPLQDRYAYSSNSRDKSNVDPNTAYTDGYSNSNSWNSNNSDNGVGLNGQSSGFSGPNSNFQFAEGDASFNQQQQQQQQRGSFSPFADSLRRPSVMQPDASAFS